MNQGGFAPLDPPGLGGRPSLVPPPGGGRLPGADPHPDARTLSQEKEEKRKEDLRAQERLYFTPLNYPL